MPPQYPNSSYVSYNDDKEFQKAQNTSNNIPFELNLHEFVLKSCIKVTFFVFLV